MMASCRTDENDLSKNFILSSELGKDCPTPEAIQQTIVSGSQNVLTNVAQGISITKTPIPTNQQTGQQTNQTGQQTNQTGQQTNQTGQQTNQTGQQTNQIGQQTNQTGQQTNQTGQQTNQTGQQTNQTKTLLYFIFGFILLLIAIVVISLFIMNRKKKLNEKKIIK
jgi:cobalamin biosynthesis Mg chelatase CobN